MAYTPFKNNASGFTLIELTAVVMIAMLITFIIFRLSNSIQGREKLSGTRARLEMISTKIKQYYRAHEQLPPVAGPNDDQLSVQPEALNMEQKYRLDEWGTYFRYNPADPLDLTNIQDVDGYAATITSAGPDQLIDPPNDRDNLIINIDLTQEATDIVLTKLKILQEKVVAYDAMFTSVDNNANGEIDENPREAAEIDPVYWIPENCPPTSTFSNDPDPLVVSNIGNDPSEGLTTLDAIESDTLPPGLNCGSPLVDHIVSFYGLKSGIPGGYDSDPWRDLADPINHNPFAWGYEGRLLDGGDSITDQDRRYHRFYSWGPDRIDGTDDDITYSVQ